MPCFRSATDLAQYAFEIGQDFIIPEAKHNDALRGEPTRAAIVTCASDCIIVLAPIHFDGEMNGRTIEVEHIDSDRMLPAKIQSVDLITSYGMPELLFSLRQNFAKASRTRR